MQVAIAISEGLLHDFLQSFNNPELDGNLGSDSNEGEKHALVESKGSLLGDGLLDCMDVALVVLLWLGDDLDLNVLEGEHADHLPPAGHAPAEQILHDIMTH